MSYWDRQVPTQSGHNLQKLSGHNLQKWSFKLKYILITTASLLPNHQFRLFSFAWADSSCSAQHKFWKREIIIIQNSLTPQNFRFLKKEERSEKMRRILTLLRCSCCLDGCTKKYVPISLVHSLYFIESRGKLKKNKQKKQNYR